MLGKTRGLKLGLIISSPRGGWGGSGCYDVSLDNYACGGSLCDYDLDLLYGIHADDTADMNILFRNHNNARTHFFYPFHRARPFHPLPVPHHVAHLIPPSTLTTNPADYSPTHSPRSNAYSGYGNSYSCSYYLRTCCSY